MSPPDPDRKPLALSDRDRAFIIAFGFVLGQEGGFVDHPADPGGATNHGVSLRYARSKGRLVDLNRDGDVDADDIRLVTADVAAALYFDDFWAPLHAWDLPYPVALAAFDAAINCGTGRAARWLQAAAGAVQDGAVGPRTIAAVTARGAAAVYAEIMALRMVHHAGLPTWRSFGLGWSRRLARLGIAAWSETIKSLEIPTV